MKNGNCPYHQNFCPPYEIFQECPICSPHESFTNCGCEICRPPKERKVEKVERRGHEE